MNELIPTVANSSVAMVTDVALIGGWEEDGNFFSLWGFHGDSPAEPMGCEV